MDCWREPLGHDFYQDGGHSGVTEESDFNSLGLRSMTPGRPMGGTPRRRQGALPGEDTLQAFWAQGEETPNRSLLWGSHGTAGETER